MIVYVKSGLPCICNDITTDVIKLIASTFLRATSNMINHFEEVNLPHME